MFRRKRSSLFLLLLISALANCAFDLAHVSSSPAQFTASLQTGTLLTLTDEVKIVDAPCGYARTLKKNSRWELCGSVTEGKVYKPLDQVFTVECSHVYEAYLVVDENYLSGFYLPVEGTFVSVPDKISLPIR